MPTREEWKDWAKALSPTQEKKEPSTIETLRGEENDLHSGVKPIFTVGGKGMPSRQPWEPSIDMTSSARKHLRKDGRGQANRTLPHRLLDFVEQPLFINPAMLVTGLVGMFLLTPILLVFGVCILLAFHRAKVVADQPAKIQWSVYLGLFAVTTVGLYFLGIFVKRNVPQLATRQDMAAMLQRLVRTEGNYNCNIKAFPEML